MDHEAESRILERARAGESDEVGALLEDYRPRLERMIAVRMDPRLRRRIDAADVLQEAFVDVTRRLPAYFERDDMPFFLWVRFLTGQKLAELQRRHLGTAARDARAETSEPFRAGPEASSIRMAQILADSAPSPSGVAMREEARQHLEAALANMSDADREVLALRHFERLGNAEAASVLGLTESGASRRYMRALGRLQDVLSSLASHAPGVGPAEPAEGEEGRA